MSNTVITEVKVKSRGVYSIAVTEDSRSLKYELSEGTYREIGSPLSGYFIEDSVLDVIKSEDEMRRCLRRALRILECADKSKSALYMKLISLGFSKDAVGYAIGECERLGYVDEERTVSRIVLSLASRDLLGPRKIYQRLLSRGYRGATVCRVISSLTQSGEVDFEKSKQELIQKKQPQDEEELNRLLFKYGYLYD